MTEKTCFGCSKKITNVEGCIKCVCGLWWCEEPYDCWETFRDPVWPRDADDKNKEGFKGWYVCKRDENKTFIGQSCRNCTDDWGFHPEEEMRIKEREREEENKRIRLLLAGKTGGGMNNTILYMFNDLFD